MPKVVGVFEQSQSGGAVETVGLVVLSLSGSWTLGVAPATWTCEVDTTQLIKPQPAAGGGPGGGGPVITGGSSGRLPASQLQSIFDPGRAKMLIGGDTDHWMRHDYLWLQSADPSELREGRAVHVVTLMDRRVWWAKRGEMGSRAWNLEQWNEAVSPFVQLTPSPYYGSNPRYHAHSLRTVRQMFQDIFAFLGVDVANMRLDGGDGFLNIDSVQVQGHNGARIPLGTHTPPFFVPEGEPVTGTLQRLCAEFDLEVAISPDTLDVGLVAKKALPLSLGASLQWVQDQQVPGSNPVIGASVGWDADDLPDAAFLRGRPIMLGDVLTLEPVCRDPDNPERWIPLYRSDTLEAYGVRLDLPGRSHLKGAHGNKIAGLVTALATMEDLAPEIHPRWHAYVREWLRIWRVAMPLETTLTTEIGTWEEGDRDRFPSDRAAREVSEVDPGTGQPYRRIKSPGYRLARNYAIPGGQYVDQNGRTLWEPSVVCEMAEPHRCLPLLPHTERTSTDGTHSLLEVWGANVLRPAMVPSTMGNEAPDWVDVGPVVTAENAEEERERLDLRELANLGIQPTVIDADLGILDMHQQIVGSDGEIRQSERLITEYTPNGDLTRKRVRVESSWATWLLSRPGNGRGVTPADLWYREQRCNSGKAPVPAGFEEEVAAYPEVEGTIEGPAAPCTPTHLGFAYLVLRGAFWKGSHGDDRDWTASFAEYPGGRPDLLFSAPGKLVLEGLSHNLYTQEGLLGSTASTPPGFTVRGNPAAIHSIQIPDLALRCRTARCWKLPKPRHSFHREGGFASGKLTGVNYWMDRELVKDSDLRGGFRDDGKFAPESAAHYRRVWAVLSDAARAIMEELMAWRGNVDAVRVLNVELAGWWRNLCVGHGDYEDRPFDAVSFSGNGDAATATCRGTVNSRGWRPYVGSASERRAIAAIANAARTASGNSQKGGGS